MVRGKRLKQARHLGQARGQDAALLVLAAALSAVEAFLGEQVADGLEEATLADLAGNGVVDAVLQRVNLLDARDLGLVELV